MSDPAPPDRGNPAGSAGRGAEPRSEDEPTDVRAQPAPAPAPAPAAMAAPAPPADPDAPKSVGAAILQGVKGVGSPVQRFLDTVGGHLILAAKALSWLPRRPFRMTNYLEAAEYIGFGSLPIVLLVGFFTGAVMSLQSVAAFRQFGLESFSGGTTGKALSLELGPVLCSLMLAGRAGSGIATELGTMRISEQIDALESMAVNPIQYLILPRVIAGMLVTPILALLFFVIGMFGAFLVAVPLSHVDQGAWISNVQDIVQPIDVVQGLIKCLVFGFLITLIGCYQGFHASGGGRGVGLGTTRAVVLGSVSTLVVDYFLSDILLAVLGNGKGH